MVQQIFKYFLMCNKCLNLDPFLFGKLSSASLIIASTDVKINHMISFCENVEFKGFHCSGLFLLIFKCLPALPSTFSSSYFTLLEYESS